MMHKIVETWANWDATHEELIADNLTFAEAVRQVETLKQFDRERYAYPGSAYIVRAQEVPLHTEYYTRTNH